MLLLIPVFLTPQQQGYWYLFGSIAALSVFADLGFSNIILQFAAHEYAFLSTSEQNILIGDITYIKKLGGFFRYVIKWIGRICLIVYPIIVVVGIWFFIRDGVLSIYLIPWIIYSIGSFTYFFSNTILSFIEGLDKIAKIQEIRLFSAISNTIIVSTCLVCNLNIYALSFSVFFSSLVLIFNTIYNFHKTLLQLLKESSGFNYDWKIEILPLFIRYALSFASGYFIFQIYTPLMHYFHGPVYSGKVGITLNFVTTAFNLSGIWMYTIIPRINILISRKEWIELDKIFYKRLFLSLFSYIVIVCCFYAVVYFFRDFLIIPKIVPRFLDNYSIIILFMCYFIQQIINAFALYLRGHKKEPFVIPSIISAVWILVFTLIIGNFYPPSFFFLGLLSSYAWGLPLAFILFFSLKKKWHSMAY
jgi:hypothetical protein